MNKNIILITLIVAISLTGCNLAWQRVDSKELGFSILLPRVWYKEEGVYNTTMMITSPQEGPSDKFQENITIVVANLPTEISLESFFASNKEETLRIMPGDQFDISEGEIFAGRFRGKQLSFNTKLEGVVIRILSAVWIRGKRVYVITCSAEYEQYSKYKSTFQKTLKSLRIK